MARDFRTDQIRTTQIIASGSRSGKPSIMIVSASHSPTYSGEAIDDNSVLGGVGEDVFLFVSGSSSAVSLFAGDVVSSGSFHSHGASIFEGDVIISGTLQAERIVVEVEEATTGSLSVSGSLVVSQSATIFEGLVVNETGEGGAENDFRVESLNEDEALFIDANADTLYINKGETAFTTIISSDNDEAFRVGSAGVVLNEDGHATNDFRVETTGEDEALFIDAGGNSLHINKGETAFETHIASTNDVAVSVTAAGVVFNEDGNSTNDFRVETVNSSHALFIDSSGGGTSADIMFGTSSPAGADAFFTVSGSMGIRDTVHYDAATAVIQGDFLVSGTTVLGAGLEAYAAQPTMPTLIVGATGSVPIHNDTDVGVFISGSIGQKGTAGTYGTVLFGGDVTTSGSLFVEKNILINDSGHSNQLHAGLSALGTLDIMSSKTPVSDLHDPSDYHVILRSISASGEAGIGFSAASADNVGAGIVYKDQGSFNQGDLIFYNKDASQDEANPTEKLRLTHDGRVYVTSGTAPSEAEGADVFFYVSGSGNSSLQSLANATLDRGVTLFGGSVSMSGTLNVATIDSLTGSDISFRYGGVEAARIGSVGSKAGIEVASALLHMDDSDTGVFFTPDQVYIDAGGKTALSAVEDTVDKLYLGSYNADTHAAGSYKYDQVFIMSGGIGAGSGGTSLNPADFADIGFFVSGAIGSRGTSDKGTSLFGGDVAISGSLFVGHLEADGQEEPVLVVDYTNRKVGIGIDTPTYGLDIRRSDNTVFNATNDYSTGDGHIRVSNLFGTVGTSTGIIFGNSSHPSTAGLLSTVDPEQSSGADVVKVVLDAHRNDAVVIRGKEDTRSHNQVLILSGGGETSFNEASGADVAFYVSGTVGSKGTSIRGASVFGGDVFVSGVLYSDDLSITDDFTLGDDLILSSDGAKIKFGAAAEVTLTHVQNTGLLLSDDSGIGVTKLMFGDSATFIQQQADGELGIDADSVINITAPTVDIDASSGVNVSTTMTVEDKLTVNAPIAIIGDTIPEITLNVKGVGSQEGALLNLQDSAEDDKFIVLSADQTHISGSDIVLFVSGAIGDRGGSHRGVAVFGGDMFVSGGLVVGKEASQSEDGSSQNFTVNSKNVVGIVNVSGDDDTIQFATADQSGALPIGSDTFFHVSGSLSGGTSGKDSNGVSVFGGDVVVSGTLWGGNNPAAGGASILMQRADIHVVQGGAIPGILGSDTALYVSGTPGSLGHNVRGTAVFGGDAFVSGGMMVGAPPTQATDGSSENFTVNSKNVVGLVHVSGDDDTIQFVTEHNGAAIPMGDDTFFQVSGSIGGKDDTSDNGGVSVFGGDVVTSGSILPGLDSTVDLGSATHRFANVYTGDLHLRNERGNWTIVEEVDYLCVVNNITGKKYKMMLEPIDD